MSRVLCLTVTPGLPERFHQFAADLADWRSWIWSAVFHWMIFRLVRRAAARKNGPFWELVIEYWQTPARFVLPALGLLAIVPELEMPREVASSVIHVVGIAWIAVLAWATLATLDLLQDFVASGHATQLADDLAARSTLTNLVAGVQIALTHPIHLEDVVIVEGEWGWVEEITTTYVIVRVWDLRRLVVPLSYFIEKPFQNWTRRTSDLLGTVFVYTDYSVPVEAVREFPASLPRSRAEFVNLSGNALQSRDQSK
jgi:small-conductance mechanosensitive channel